MDKIIINGYEITEPKVIDMVVNYAHENSCTYEVAVESLLSEWAWHYCDSNN